MIKVPFWSLGQNCTLAWIAFLLKLSVGVNMQSNHFKILVQICSNVMMWCMMTLSNGNIFRVTGHLCGEFTGPRWIPRTKAGPVNSPHKWPVTRSFDVFFDLRLNKRLSKQSWGWWLETLSRPSWRHCNVISSTLPLICPDTTIHDSTGNEH